MDDDLDYISPPPKIVKAYKLMPDWQPIETAPRDGTRILVCRSGSLPFHDVVEWCDWKPGWLNGDMAGDADAYTHWMPLPAAPKT